MEENNILEVKRLKVSFRTDNGTVKAVRDISFDLYRGRTLAIVGESGSGKSVTSRAILGILAGNAIVENGEILMFEGITGKVTAEMQIDAQIKASPAVYNDIMVFGTTGKGTEYVMALKIH